MAIHFKCPNPKCGRFIQVADGMVGKTVVCPTCRQSVTIPANQPQEGGGDQVALEAYQRFLRTLNQPDPAAEQGAPPDGPAPSLASPPVAPRSVPRPAARPEARGGFDDLTALAVEAATPATIGRLPRTPASWKHIVPLPGSLLKACLRAVRHPGVDAGIVIIAAICLAALETYRRQLLPCVVLGTSGIPCAEMALVGGLLLSVVLGGYCLAVCLAATDSAVAGGSKIKTGTRRGFVHVVRTGLLGTAIAVVYVLPIVTLPLLPLGLLTLSLTGNGRAFDLRWQVKAAFRYGDGFAVLWLVLVVGIAVIGAVWWAMLAVSQPLAEWVAGMSAGVEGKTIAGVALFLLAMISAVFVILLACGMFRCIGLLARYKPAVVEAMPTTCPTWVSVLIVAASVLVAALLMYAIH